MDLFVKPAARKCQFALRRQRITCLAFCELQYPLVTVQGPTIAKRAHKTIQTILSGLLKNSALAKTAIQFRASG
jgi:hypothetical protein